jgi:TetR/AcrR family transcriptional regulator, fatty acid metabolism regulator protein
LERAINRNKKKNDKRERILEAAGKIFAEKGFSKSTVAMIAKEAGVASGTIYLYYSGKEDLYIHFFSYKTELFFKQLREEADRGETALEKLEKLIRRHLEEFQKDWNMAVLYQSETHHVKRLAPEPIREMSRMYQEIIAEIMEQGQEEGWIRKSLYTGLVKRLIIGAVDEVINTWIHAGGNYDLATMAHPLVDLFINGIGSSAIKDKKS